MQLRHLLALLAACVSGLALAHGSIARRAVEDVRVLMVAAIDSPTGEAHGVLVNKDADAITQRFRASGPILIDVTTEQRYQQQGCSRLKITLSQDGVHLPGAASPERRAVDFGLNYCRDGTPPKSLP